MPRILSNFRKISFSFEFFPPKTEAMEETLWRSVERLAPLAPDFVSVTYGAGGSTRQRTHHTIERILNETILAPAAHRIAVYGIAPAQPAHGVLGIGVEQQLVRIEPVPFFGLVGTMHPVAVRLTRACLRQVAVPDMVGTLAQCDTL